MRFFLRVKDRHDLDACVNVLLPEDVRAEFTEAFRRFAQSLDMILPDPKGLPYLRDFRWLGKIRKAAGARFQDQSLDISDCAPKVRKLIEDAIVAEGIQGRSAVQCSSRSWCARCSSRSRRDAC